MSAKRGKRSDPSLFLQSSSPEYAKHLNLLARSRDRVTHNFEQTFVSRGALDTLREHQRIWNLPDYDSPCRF